MQLYHFTACDNLTDIASEGLTKHQIAEAPEGAWPAYCARRFHGVWLTEAAHPHNQGLPAADLEVRLSVWIGDNDPKLIKWTDWGPTRLSAETYDSISERGDSGEWWIYLDDIPIWRISEPVTVHDHQPMPKRWPDDFKIQAAPPGGTDHPPRRQPAYVPFRAFQVG
jgi:hypothetical protein